MSKVDGDVCETCRYWDFQETIELKEASGPQERSSVFYGQSRRYAPAALHEREGRPSITGQTAYEG